MTTVDEEALAPAFGHDTEINLGPRPGGISSGSLTAVNTPDAGTNSGEITAESVRAVESILSPTAQPASDPTTSTKIDPGFIHLVPGTIVAEYEIEKLLGSGGMGAVYGAHHERLRRKVAIKVIAPNLSADRSAVERFEQEALALAKLCHPNIVAVLSIGTLPGDGRSYYVMEWLSGESLHELLARGPVPLDVALDVLDQIARGLDAAHAAGIIHRDLKPDNCWLQEVGGEERRVVRILDFGLAKLAQHSRSEDTAVNVMFGTPSYMSPEQCESARDVGPETDAYALGCVAYQVLCNRLPFAYDNMAELVAAHGSEAPPLPRSLNPTLAPELDELLLAMLAKDPSKRPTMSQIRRVLANVTTPKLDPRRPISRTRNARMPLAIVGVILAGIVIVMLIRTRAQRPEDLADRAVGIEPDAGTLFTQESTASDALLATPEPPSRPDADAGPGSGRAPLRSRSATVDAAPTTDGGERPMQEPEVRDAPLPEPTAVQRPMDAGVKPPVVPPVRHPTPPVDGSRDADRDRTFNPFERKPAR